MCELQVPNIARQRFRMPMVLIAVYQFQLPLKLSDIAFIIKCLELQSGWQTGREFISVLPKYE